MQGNLLRGYHFKQASLCTFTGFVTDPIVAEDVNGHPKSFQTEEFRETTMEHNIMGDMVRPRRTSGWATYSRQKFKISGTLGM
jgi:hypothetical protein